MIRSDKEKREGMPCLALAAGVSALGGTLNVSEVFS